MLADLRLLMVVANDNIKLETISKTTEILDNLAKEKS